MKIPAAFGHEVMALNFAKVFGIPAIIAPKADNEQEFERSAKANYANMHFFYPSLLQVSQKELEKYQPDMVDIIASVQGRRLPDSAWRDFAKSTLTPTEPTIDLPQFRFMWGRFNVGIIPAKFMTDGKCGLDEKQQSLFPYMFSFLTKYNVDPILVQHFNKVDDKEAVLATRKDIPNLSIPGETENPELFGIRGVQHKMYYNMYKQLNMCIGVPGTHTWILLTMFPDTPQIILFNRNGAENWEAIAAAYQERKKKIYALGFDENTNMSEFSRQIEKQFVALL